MGDTFYQKAFAYTAVGLQLLFIALFAIFIEYDHESASHSQEGELAGHQYTYFTDVHVMIFIGFGYLMTFLKKYGYSAVGLNFFLSALAIQWVILVNGFWNKVEGGKWSSRIPMGMEAVIEGDFGAGAVMISFGAVIGKVNPLQLVVMLIGEISMYGLNKMVCEKLYKISDVGGSLIIHTFGAYFGLMVSRIVSSPSAKGHKHAAPRYDSDIFAMIGTIFLWIMWPSFNAALCPPGTIQNRAILNTILSLSAACVTTFALSILFRHGHKIDMVDIQNATLAGGVAVGASANMNLWPVGALSVGFVAAIVSNLGFNYLQPFLERKIGLHDTCGVHNLHGMPGVIGGLTSIVVSALHQSSYGDNKQLVFPATKTRPISEQPGYQLAGLATTLGIALVSGLIVGFIMKLKIFVGDGKHSPTFEDSEFWHTPENHAEFKKSEDPGFVELQVEMPPIEKKKNKGEEV